MCFLGPLLLRKPFFLSPWFHPFIHSSRRCFQAAISAISFFFSVRGSTPFLFFFSVRVLPIYAFFSAVFYAFFSVVFSGGNILLFIPFSHFWHSCRLSCFTLHTFLHSSRWCFQASTFSKCSSASSSTMISRWPTWTGRKALSKSRPKGALTLNN